MNRIVSHSYCVFHLLPCRKWWKVDHDQYTVIDMTRAGALEAFKQSHLRLVQSIRPYNLRRVSCIRYHQRELGVEHPRTSKPQNLGNIMPIAWPRLTVEWVAASPLISRTPWPEPGLSPPPFPLQSNPPPVAISFPSPLFHPTSNHQQGTEVHCLRLHDAETDARFEVASGPDSAVDALLELKANGTVNEISIGMNNAEFFRKFLRKC